MLMKVKYVAGGYLCRGYHRYHHQDHPHLGCHHCHRPGQWSRQYRRHQSHGPGTSNFRHILTTDASNLMPEHDNNQQSIH